ncbi:MAG: ABC transporter permease [Chloroflexi bacterium]|nr:ABC transporter permease [Chloroflexota bacterium]
MSFSPRFAKIWHFSPAPLAILCLIVLSAACAPLLAPHDPLAANPDALSLAPGALQEHPLGTDRFGRDVLSRALYGGQHTLLIAAGATATAIALGLALGTLSGLGARWDMMIAALLNALLALPGLLLAFVVVTLLGRGEVALLLATGLTQVAPYARVVRGALLASEGAGYVQAAEALGASRVRVLLRHRLPNALPALAAYGAAVFSYCLLNSAALSFLGLGAAPETPDWGLMLAEGRAGFRVMWWASVVPGALITLTVWAVNALSEGVGARNPQ